MQIHELNNYNGELGSSAYLAVDNGNDTGKVSVTQLLNDMTNDLEQAEETLNARIDNIIAGGDAPSAAEITDARLGAAALGSVAYPSLGDAIRGQATELKKYLDNTSKYVEYAYDLVWTDGRYILASTGGVGSAAGYACTEDYYPVYDGQILAVNLYANGYNECTIAFYDSSKQFLSYETGTGANTVTVPSDGYARFATKTNKVSVADAYVINYSEPVEHSSLSKAYDEISFLKDFIQNADYYYDLVWTSGGFINASNEITTLAGYIYTEDYYPVIGGAQIEVNLYATGPSDAAVNFYDDNKTMLGTRIYTVGGTVDVPDQAVYMRLSNNTAYIPESDCYVKSYIEEHDNYNYFNVDRSADVCDETVKKTYCSTPAIRNSYKGHLNRQKRFLAIGFDDLRVSDLNMIMPLFEKYRARATFNKVFTEANASPREKNRVWRTFMGQHELGDHTFLHYSFPYFDPLWNGQDPDAIDGNQTPFPTNSDFRSDVGDGKNVFGKTLTSIVNIGGVSGVTWANLTNAQCQTIREHYSAFKNPTLSVLLDNLSNKYLGTSGSSAGSFDNITQKYTGGIFTGCSTSSNFEIWERINDLIAMYMKDELGVNWNMYTWSKPGTESSGLYVTYDGEPYYDPNHLYLRSPQTRFRSSLTGEDRSWTDVLLNCGYKVSHDYLVTSNMNYYWISRQMFFDASLSRRDAIASMTNKSVEYSAIETAYPASFFSGAKSKAAQMYDSIGGPFRKMVEAIRSNTANGIIWGEMIDSVDNYSFRVFFENILRYCESAGVEIITKAEAYNISFENIVDAGNLICNENLRNTAAEFMGDSETLPTNPDGYSGSCTVSSDTNGLPVLVTSGETNYFVFGVPYGKLKFTADIKGSGTIKFRGIPNNKEISIGDYNYQLLGTITVDSSADFTAYEQNIIVPKAPLEAYEPYFEGYGNRICALKIIYSSGLEVKNIRLVVD